MSADHTWAALHDKGGELVPIHFGENDQEIGQAAVCDPHLLAPQDVVASIGRERGFGLGGQGVGAGVRFSQAKRGYQLSTGESRQVFGALLGSPKIDDRQRADSGLCAEGGRERRVERHLLRDQRRAYLVQPHPSILFGNIGSQQVETSGMFEQLAGCRPVMRVELFRMGHYLFAHKLLRSAGKQLLLFADVFPDKDTFRGVLPKKKAAAGRSACGGGMHGEVVLSLAFQTRYYSNLSSRKKPTVQLFERSRPLTCAGALPYVRDLKSA